MFPILMSNCICFGDVLQRPFSVEEIAKEVYIKIMCFHIPVCCWIIVLSGLVLFVCGLGFFIWFDMGVLFFVCLVVGFLILFIYGRQRKGGRKKRNLKGVIQQSHLALASLPIKYKNTFKEISFREFSVIRKYFKFLTPIT